MTGDPFTFEDGIPDYDDAEGDDEMIGTDAPMCPDCWTYHRGPCL